MNVADDEKHKLESGGSGLVSIIQITDTHILDDGAPTFNDFDTSASLIRVIEKIKKTETDADLILLTGDLVHEPTRTAYQKLADHLSALTIPVLSLPGNHDAPELMRSVMSENGHDTGNVVKLNNWLIILLNSAVQGQHSGELSANELAFLRRSLGENPELDCLIALHHHPVAINSQWMDAMALKNAKELFNIIDDFGQVRGIIWGHIHQEFVTNRNQIKLYGTPSTCIQFEPGSDEFTVSNKTPAYRKLLLKADGALMTEVKYLTT